MPKKPIKDEKVPEPTWVDVQCNLSAMLYLLAEQQALLGKLLEELSRIGALDHSNLNQITGVKQDSDALTSVYTQLYQQFTNYFLISKKFLESAKEEPE